MPLPYTITYVIRDAKDSLSTSQFYLDSTADPSEAVAAAREIIDIIAPLVEGTIDTANFSIPLDLVGVGLASPLPGADVEEGARFDFRAGPAGEFKTSQRIATFSESRILPGTRTVDRADAQVFDFEQAMTSSVTGTTYGGTVPVRVVDSRNEGITELRSAVESFLRSRGTR